MPMRCRKALLVVVADAALAWPSLVGAEPYAGLFAGIAFSQRSDIEEPFVESRTNIFAESMTFEDTDVRLGFQGRPACGFFSPATSRCSRSTSS